MDSLAHDSTWPHTSRAEKAHRFFACFAFHTSHIIICRTHVLHFLEKKDAIPCTPRPGGSNFLDEEDAVVLTAVFLVADAAFDAAVGFFKSRA